MQSPYGPSRRMDSSAGDLTSELFVSSPLTPASALRVDSCQAVPAWVAEVEAEMIVAPMDWQLLAERGTAWMSYWDRHVRGGDRMASR